MSYDPTEWAPQPGQQPAQPPATPPVPPAYGQQAPQPQYPSVDPTVYSQPQQGASYGQPQQPAPYGQPQQPQQPPATPYGQPQQAAPYGQPSNPSYPPVGQPSSPSYPAYGQPSSPSYPPVGQPSNPSYPGYGAPAQAEQPSWGTVPPGYAPPSATPKKKSPALLITIIVLLVVLIGGGIGGYAFYQATRPKPVITVTSKFTDGSTPLAATSTDGFTIKGTDFTANSAITFYTDSQAFPSDKPITSDSKGDVTATLTVGEGWTPGFHTITAKDAAGYATKTGIKVEIVTAGKSGTPGPNGAPTDSANMTVTAAVTVSGNSEVDTLTVKNGSVCSSNDDGQSHSSNHTTSNGVSYVETIASTCAGSYAAGKLTYTETYTIFKAVYSNGLVCSIPKPFVAEHLEGTFSNGTTVSGTFSSEATSFDCNLGAGSVPISAESGTWTGTAVVS
jgi:hypothetical protein